MNDHVLWIYLRLKNFAICFPYAIIYRGVSIGWKVFMQHYFLEHPLDYSYKHIVIVFCQAFNIQPEELYK